LNSKPEVPKQPKNAKPIDVSVDTARKNEKNILEEFQKFKILIRILLQKNFTKVGARIDDKFCLVFSSKGVNFTHFSCNALFSYL